MNIHRNMRGLETFQKTAMCEIRDKRYRDERGPPVPDQSEKWLTVLPASEFPYETWHTMYFYHAEYEFQG